MIRRPIVHIIAAYLLLMLLAGTPIRPAHAHGVSLFAYLDNGMVYTESYFSDGRPVVGGKVTVADRHQKPLIHGETDKQGLWSFPLSGALPLVITLDASLGHRHTFTLRQAKQ